MLAAEYRRGQWLFARIDLASKWARPAPRSHPDRGPTQAPVHQKEAG